MRRFARHQITMNCQIVSCPGINDGPALDRTLRDLAEMFPAVHSVSVVPVGVTKYREGLYPLRPHTREEAGGGGGPGGGLCGGPPRRPRHSPGLVL